MPRELVMANGEILPLKHYLMELLPLWPKITQCVTVMQGKNDTLVQPENADFAKRVMTETSPLLIIWIPGMNHFLPWRKYDLVKATIIKYLGE